MNVTDEQLNNPTPCLKLSLRDPWRMWAAWRWRSPRLREGEFGELNSDTPPVEGAPLDRGLAHRIPGAATCRRAGRGRGENRRPGKARHARGVDFPGEVAGIVAMTEVVIHGWDLAAATGQAYDVDPVTLDVGASARDRDRRRGSGRGTVRAGGAGRR